MLLGSCSLFLLWMIPDVDVGPSLTTNSNSDSMASAEERVAFVSRYIKPKAPIVDASFRIVYQDNGQGLPGPSDWSESIALRVHPADSQQWLAGANLETPGNAKEPLSRQFRRVIPDSWGVSSSGDIYYLNGAWLIWHSEGALEHLSTTF
ncbi:MAG: hypothetical protein ABIY63_08980 [Fibrobacteria bacterium]